MTVPDYDVFISFKNLLPDGRPTRDSIIAREVYDYLFERGLLVFLSNISLESLGTSEYKKAIDDSLDKAKVLVAVGTSKENFESRWVRYEWDAFLNEILSGVKSTGCVFAYVEEVDIYDLPFALRQVQTFKHTTGTLEALFKFISNALGKDVEIPRIHASSILKPEHLQVGGKSSIVGRDIDMVELFIPSGRMGPPLSAVSVNYNWNSSDCYPRSACIKNSFEAIGHNWGGIYWQYPENNWGTVPIVGRDLSGFTQIVFWAKGQGGGEKIEFFALGIGRDRSSGNPITPYPDSSPVVTIGFQTLSAEWVQYRIDLRGKDLSYVVGGFGWVTNSSANPQGAEFFLDAIKYLSQ
jgi:hypothetical protein